MAAQKDLANRWTNLVSFTRKLLEIKNGPKNLKQRQNVQDMNNY